MFNIHFQIPSYFQDEPQARLLPPAQSTTEPKTPDIQNENLKHQNKFENPLILDWEARDTSQEVSYS